MHLKMAYFDPDNKVFVADHPFVYLIKSESNPLFIGNYKSK